MCHCFGHNCEWKRQQNINYNMKANVSGVWGGGKDHVRSTKCKQKEGGKICLQDRGQEK